MPHVTGNFRNMENHWRIYIYILYIYALSFDETLMGDFHGINSKTGKLT